MKTELWLGPRSVRDGRRSEERVKEEKGRPTTEPAPLITSSKGLEARGPASTLLPLEPSCHCLNSWRVDTFP